MMTSRRITRLWVSLLKRTELVNNDSSSLIRYVTVTVTVQFNVMAIVGSLERCAVRTAGASLINIINSFPSWRRRSTLPLYDTAYIILPPCSRQIISVERDFSAACFCVLTATDWRTKSKQSIMADGTVCGSDELMGKWARVDEWRKYEEAVVPTIPGIPRRNAEVHWWYCSYIVLSADTRLTALQCVPQLATNRRLTRNTL